MSVVAAENRSLGHYRLLEKIGSGGMGEVYRAHDEHLDRDVAVKILSLSSSPDRAPDSRARRALQQEAHALSRLNHPNIATIYDLASEGDTEFIVMEYIAGESLASRLAREAIPHRSVAEYRGANSGRPCSSARAGHHPSRPEAGQPADYARGTSQNPRLRTGAVDSPGGVDAGTATTDENVVGHQRDPGLHGSGTTVRGERRCADGLVGGGSGALPDDRPAVAIQGAYRRRHGRCHPARPSAGPHRGGSGTGIAGHRRTVSGERSDSSVTSRRKSC